MKIIFKLTFMYFINLSVVAMLSLPLIACTTAKLKRDQKLINDVLNAINNDPTINYDNAPVQPVKNKILDIIRNTNFLSKKDWDLENAHVIIKSDSNDEITNLKLSNHLFEVTIAPALGQYQITTEKKIIGNFSVSNKEKLKSFSSSMLSEFKISKINKILGSFNLNDDISDAIKKNIRQALRIQWYDNDIEVIFASKKPEDRLANEIKKTSHFVEFRLKSKTNESDSRSINFIYTINPVNLNGLEDITEVVPIKTESNNLASIANISARVNPIILNAIKKLDNGAIIRLEMLNIKYFENDDYKNELTDKKLNSELQIYVQIEANRDNVSKIINTAKIKVKIKSDDQ